MLKMDGFDDCVLGVAEGFDGIPRIIYSEALIVKKLCKEMSLEEAWDYFNFNIRGAYMGTETPLILEEMSLEDIEERIDEWA